MEVLELSLIVLGVMKIGEPSLNWKKNLQFGRKKQSCFWANKHIISSSFVFVYLITTNKHDVNAIEDYFISIYELITIRLSSSIWVSALIGMLWLNLIIIQIKSTGGYPIGIVNIFIFLTTIEIFILVPFWSKWRQCINELALYNKDKSKTHIVIPIVQYSII